MSAWWWLLLTKTCSKLYIIEYIVVFWLNNILVRATSAWAKCLGLWVGYWKAKKFTSHLVFVRSLQNWFRQGVEQFTMRSTNLLFVFGIRRNCLRSGRSWLLYLSIRRAIKQILVIVEAYHFCQLYTKFYPASWCQG